MDSRVFVLGAGASREDSNSQEFIMPLANDFFKDYYLSNFWPSSDFSYSEFSDSNLKLVLERYFNFQKSDKINVEEVYSFLASFETVYRSLTYQRKVFKEAKRELEKYIYRLISIVQPLYYFPSLEEREKGKFEGIAKYTEDNVKNGLKTHNFIASNLKEPDSILSFNWDLYIDLALKVNEKLEYFERQKMIAGSFFNKHGMNMGGYLKDLDLHKGYLLKLHGSINLATCSNKNCLRNEFPFIVDEVEYDMYEMFQCNLCGSPIELLFMPPHVNKTFHANRFFQLQAFLAAKKIQRAKELYIIGYSFPNFDFEANTIFRLLKIHPFNEGEEINLERLIIVNPDIKEKKYQKRFRKIFGLNDHLNSFGKQIEFVPYESIDKFISSESL